MILLASPLKDQLIFYIAGHILQLQLKSVGKTIFNLNINDTENDKLLKGLQHFFNKLLKLKNKQIQQRVINTVPNQQKPDLNGSVCLSVYQIEMAPEDVHPMLHYSG